MLYRNVKRNCIFANNERKMCFLPIHLHPTKTKAFGRFLNHKNSSMVISTEVAFFSKNEAMFLNRGTFVWHDPQPNGYFPKEFQTLVYSSLKMVLYIIFYFASDVRLKTPHSKVKKRWSWNVMKCLFPMHWHH